MTSMHADQEGRVDARAQYHRALRADHHGRQGARPEPVRGSIVAALSSAIKKAHRRAPKAAPDDGNGILPKADRGARSDEADEAYRAKLRGVLRQDQKDRENARLQGQLSRLVLHFGGAWTRQGQFQRCQNLINNCRKNGMLPLRSLRRGRASRRRGNRDRRRPGPRRGSRERLAKRPRLARGLPPGFLLGTRWTFISRSRSKRST